MLGRDFEDATWPRFLFELVIWTQPSGPLCLWQCLSNYSATVCLIYNILLKLNLIKKSTSQPRRACVHTSAQCMYSPLAAQRVFQLQQIRWGTPMKFWNWFGSKIINLPTLGLGFSIASRKISGRNCETEREESWWYFAVLLQRPSHLSYPSRHYHYYNAIQAVCCINIH